jgi:FixJ family two-component response regulator
MRLFCDLLSRALIGACDLELFRYPEMTGGEFAKTIQTSRPARPVILVTGYGDREILRNLGEAGILQKPS